MLVTNHDAFGYFAERYGFEIIGTVIPSLSTLGESSAGQLAELADKIEQHHVPAIFAERLGSTRTTPRRWPIGSASRSSSSTATRSSPTARRATYTGMMRANASAIAAALS